MVHIVGIDPAGAALAYYLKDEFEVKCYDMRKSLGTKPCAWAVPKSLERYIKIPKDVVLNEIYGQRTYLNNKLVSEDHQRTPLGYILNKPAFIKWLVDGTEIELGRYIKFNGSDPMIKTKEGGIVVIATGSMFQNKNKWKLLTYQYILENAKIEDDVLEFWFYTDFVGAIFGYSAGTQGKRWNRRIFKLRRIGTKA